MATGVKSGFISDAEMDRLQPGQSAPAKQQHSKPKFISDADMASMEKSEPDRFGSRIDPTELAPVAKTGLGDILANGVVKVASAVDSVSGAPTRAAISAMQDGENPFKAFASQFGESEGAPTGADIAKKAGIPDTPIAKFSGDQAASVVEKFVPGVGVMHAFMSDDAKNRTYQPTAADVAGAGVELVADPTNLLGVGEVAGAVKKGLGTIGKGTGVVADATKAAARTVPGVKTAEVVSKAGADTVAHATAAIKKMFSPTQAPDFKQLTDIAVKNGIDTSLLPEAIEFGHDSFIARASRKSAEGPLGEAALQRFHQGLDAVRDATEARISKMSGGSIPSKIEAGEIIRAGFDDGVERTFNNLDITHNRIMEAIPELHVSPEALAKIDSKLAGLEKWAKGRMERGFTNAHRAQGEQVLRAVEATRAGSGSYKQTVETLRDIGDVAFKSKNIYADVPPDLEKFADLYHTIKDGLYDSVAKAAGPEVAEELKKSNEIISQFYGNKSKIAHIIGNKNMAPERIFSALVEHGDSAKIQALKEILPPEYFQKLKGAFLESQIKRTADDGFTFRSLHNNLRNKKNVLEHLLDGDEINDLGELIKLGDRFGDPILSKSGTGASAAFTDIGKSIGDDAQNSAVIEYLKDSARKKGAPQPPPTTPPNTPAPSSVNNTPAIAAPKRSFEESAAAAVGVNAGAKAGTAQEKKTGPERWVSDGVVVLQQHDPSIDSTAIEKAKKSPRLRELLFRASTLKPGSPQLNRIAEEIRAEGQVQ